MSQGDRLVKCVSTDEADRRFGRGSRLTFEPSRDAVRLRGVIDASNAEIFREWLALQPEGCDLVIDIRGVRFEGEAGLRVLEEAARGMHGSRRLILGSFAKPPKGRSADEPETAAVIALRHP
jgi:hypothetical protein